MLKFEIRIPNSDRKWNETIRTLMVEFRNRSFRKRLKNIFGKSRQSARENFQGENNKKFDLTLFRKETIQIVFDALHGISNEEARDENFIMKFISNFLISTDLELNPFFIP